MARPAVAIVQGRAADDRGRHRRGFGGRLAAHDQSEDARPKQEDRSQQYRKAPDGYVSHGYTTLKRSLSIDAVGAPSVASTRSTASIMGGGPQTK